MRTYSFQSTLPARGATRRFAKICPCLSISIHAPCTGSDVQCLKKPKGKGNFNPRSLHGERPILRTSSDTAPLFQSTLPARGATLLHAVREYIQKEGFQSTLPARGATTGTPSGRAMCAHFNPRSLHGERRTRCGSTFRRRDFNPRSLHGERRDICGHVEVAQDFNPRSLHGERPCALRVRVVLSQFQSTLPARGATFSGNSS